MKTDVKGQVMNLEIKGLTKEDLLILAEAFVMHDSLNENSKVPYNDTIAMFASVFSSFAVEASFEREGKCSRTGEREFPRARPLLFEMEMEHPGFFVIETVEDGKRKWLMSLIQKYPACDYEAEPEGNVAVRTTNPTRVKYWFVEENAKRYLSQLVSRGVVDEGYDVVKVKGTALAPVAVEPVKKRRVRPKD